MKDLYLLDVNPALVGDYVNSMIQADYTITAIECIRTGSDGGNIGSLKLAVFRNKQYIKI